MLSYKEDYRHAHEKLAGTVVRLNSYPVIIHEVGRDGNVTYRGLTISDRDDHNRKKEHLSKFDLSPLPLGYVNLPTSADYVKRLAARRYRQGMRNDCFVSKNRKARLDSNSIINTILNYYPPLDGAIEQVFNGETGQRAYHRFFSILQNKDKEMETFKLMYKERTVGTVDSKKSLLTLSPRYEYLTEALQESY